MPDDEPGQMADGGDDGREDGAAGGVPGSRSGDGTGDLSGDGMASGGGSGAERSGLELLLEAELRALGRSIRIPDVDGGTMAERVVASILAGQSPGLAPDALPGTLRDPEPDADADAEPEYEPEHEPPGRARPLRGWLRQHRRALAVTLSGTLVALALTPPVRASVVEWVDRFDFGGIDVRYDPGSRSPDGGRRPEVPGCGEPLPRAEAERQAGFEALVPEELGAPDAFSVTAGAGGRSVLTLCWSGPDGRVTRLDQFPARLDPGFAKTSAELPQWVQVDGGGGESGTGLWFARPHLLRLVLLDRESDRWEEQRRTAGPTLIWMSPDERTTLRLEGADALERALGIAESVP
ncbi:hypothetical protein ACFYXL_19595 [Streptomyces tsukubensis]|uniref:hypothetical protein n=1 Tax=Streptomyces tsukubensis TaxID=83656 RepID=UPI0036802004